MTDAFGDTLDIVRTRVTPSDAERKRLNQATDRLIARTDETADDLPVETDLIKVGSTARGTWLPGDQDIDLFVRFPPDVPRKDLESLGVKVGHAVLPDGRAEFAEHPYVTGTFDGFDVDLVPCYRVESAIDARSAVDRTPFHTAYIESTITPELARDVRVLKEFLIACGIYGSDLRTEGFSGYLAELLVLEFGGFRPLIENAADWHPPIEIDPEDHGTRSFDHPLVVIDPTDPARNVAAVLSPTNFARFQHHARALIEDPTRERFEISDPPPLDAGALETHLARRETTPLALRFSTPDIVADQLYPQLEKSRSNLVAELDRHEFSVLRSTSFANEHAVILIELTIDSLPRVERHAGPPVHVREHARAFDETYDGSDAYGPFIDDGRYVVEREREYSSARECLENELLSVALGPAIERALEDEYGLLVGEELTELLPECGVELARYYDPSP